MAPPVAEKDLYEDTRKFPLAYDPSQDPEVVGETEQMCKEAKSGDVDNESEDGTESDVSDLEDDHDADLWVDEDPENDDDEEEEEPMWKGKMPGL
jgi:hypothetical protein